MRSIEEVHAERTTEWMTIPSVVGIAIGKSDGHRCILVLVAENAEELANRIPTSVEGYRVVIQDTGYFRAL